MKLTKNFKLTLIIILLAISQIATSTLSTKSHRTRSQNKNKSLSKTKMDFSLIKRIFRGIGNAIMGSNEALRNKFFTMLGCLKETTAAPSTTSGARGAAYQFFDKTVDGIATAIKWLLSFPKAILGYICKWKKNIVQWISSKFAQKSLKKYRRMIEEGQTLNLSKLKKMRSAWSFIGAIKKVGTFVLSPLKYVGGALWKFALSYLAPFLKKHWKTINTAMIAIRDSFFGKNSLIGKMVACSETINAKVVTAITNFFGKIKEKYQRFKGIYGLGLPYVALYGGDMLFTAICNVTLSTELTKVADKIQKAELSKNQARETIAGGRLFGELMKFSTTFESDFKDRITVAIKANKKTPVPDASITNTGFTSLIK